MRILPYFLLCMLTLSQLGCGVFGAGGPLPFSWIQEGSQMTFDFVAGPEPYTDVYNDYTYDSAKHVTRIVIREPEWVNFQLARVSPSNSGWKGAPGIGGPVVMHLEALDGTPEPERTENGIRIPYPAECDQGFLGDVKHTLRLPAEPEEGEDYLIRGCGGEVRQRYEAVVVDTTITVPAGTFQNVFVLHNRKQHQKAYWSEKDGLIQVEKFSEEDGRLLGKYVLASKDF